MTMKTMALYLEGKNEVTTVTKTTVSVVIMLVAIMTLVLWYSTNLYWGVLHAWQWTKTLHELHSLIISTLSQCWYLHVSVSFWCITNHPKFRDTRKLDSLFLTFLWVSWAILLLSRELTHATTYRWRVRRASLCLAISAGCLLKLLCAPQALVLSLTIEQLPSKMLSEEYSQSKGRGCKDS